MHYIALDVHKRYTLATAEDERGNILQESRLEHDIADPFGNFLSRFEAGTPVAIETVGNYDWVIDRVDSLGFQGKLVNARLAKRMMCNPNKTDKLDNRGMNRLQRSGTLPVVWTPPKEVREQRELPRLRISFSHERTGLKNRVLAILRKHRAEPEGVCDSFGKKGRQLMSKNVKSIPAANALSVQMMLEVIDKLDSQIKDLDKKIEADFKSCEEINLLRSIPGIGKVFSVLIHTEIGKIERFPSGEQLANYCGLAPRVKSSGGKSKTISVRRDCNRYLKWAFIEAANAIVLNRKRFPDRYVSQLYLRIKQRRGHGKAIVAVAHSLAVSAHAILTKKEKYKKPISSTRR